MFFLGNIYYELNDLKKSILYFEQSYNKVPNSPIIINNYANALQSLGKFERAKKLFQELIKLGGNKIILNGKLNNEIKEILNIKILMSNFDYEKTIPANSLKPSISRSKINFNQNLSQ